MVELARNERIPINTFIVGSQFCRRERGASTQSKAESTLADAVA